VFQGPIKQESRAETSRAGTRLECLGFIFRVILQVSCGPIGYRLHVQQGPFGDTFPISTGFGIGVPMGPQ